jgi:hypothetical protein
MENQQRLFCKNHCCFPLQQWFLPKNRCRFSINNNGFLVKIVVDSQGFEFFLRICKTLLLIRKSLRAFVSLSKTFALRLLLTQNLCVAPHSFIDVAFPSPTRASPPGLRLAITDHRPLLLH